MTEELDPKLCNAVKRKGGRCRQTAGWRTDHLGVGSCRLHGGMLPDHRKHGGRILADRAAQATLSKWGVPIQIAPQEALLQMVWEAAGNVAWLRSQVQRMEDQDAVGSVPSTEDTVPRDWKSGLIGRVMSSTPEGTLYQRSEEERALVRLYGDWSDRLVKYAKAAIDAGIEERKVRVAEEQGRTIVLAVSNVLVQIGVPEDKILVARSLLAAEFRTLADAGTLVKK